MNHIVPGTNRGIVHDHGLVVIHEAERQGPQIRDERKSTDQHFHHAVLFEQLRDAWVHPLTGGLHKIEYREILLLLTLKSGLPGYICY